MNISEISKFKPLVVVDTPIYDHTPHGWYARNSVCVTDCVPVYRNSGGGVTDDDLTTLDEALVLSISNINRHIAAAEKLKEQLNVLLKKNKQ